MAYLPKFGGAVYGCEFTLFQTTVTSFAQSSLFIGKYVDVLLFSRRRQRGNYERAGFDLWERFHFYR
jgi:hypothetical protein